MDTTASGSGEDRLYALTEKGRDLVTIVTALDRWNERWKAPVTPFLAVVRNNEESARKSEADASALEISLLGTFALRGADARSSAVPVSSQRVLAYLALKDRAVGRLAIAGKLWPDATEFRAGASLRSALTRLDGMRGAVVSSSSGLRLAESVTVDFQSASALARRLLRPGSSEDEADLNPAAISALSVELLPDWYDDWVVDAAEDWRQTRMNALEVQARMLVDRGRLAEAAGVAQIVIRVEPLRESAHALLIRIHLADGNQAGAVREFRQYRKLLLRELGLEPTALLSGLVAGIHNR
jgi:DNA-binding SARP family transcriptional activator